MTLYHICMLVFGNDQVWAYSIMNGVVGRCLGGGSFSHMLWLFFSFFFFGFYFTTCRYDDLSTLLECIESWNEYSLLH